MLAIAVTSHDMDHFGAVSINMVKCGRETLPRLGLPLAQSSRYMWLVTGGRGDIGQCSMIGVIRWGLTY